MDAVIHQAVRLRVMAILQRNRDVSFVALRDAVGATDGNLDAHGAVLRQAGYIEARRRLGPGGFAVHYRITPAGAAAFQAYARELQQILDAAGEAAARTPASVGQRTSAAQPGRPPSSDP